MADSPFRAEAEAEEAAALSPPAVRLPLHASQSPHTPATGTSVGPSEWSGSRATAPTPGTEPTEASDDEAGDQTPAAGERTPKADGGKRQCARCLKQISWPHRLHVCTACGESMCSQCRAPRPRQESSLGSWLRGQKPMCSRCETARLEHVRAVLGQRVEVVKARADAKRTELAASTRSMDAATALLQQLFAPVQQAGQALAAPASGDAESPPAESAAPELPGVPPGLCDALVALRTTLGRATHRLAESKAQEQKNKRVLAEEQAMLAAKEADLVHLEAELAKAEPPALQARKLKDKLQALEQKRQQLERLGQEANGGQMLELDLEDPKDEERSRCHLM